jgi:WD40 repeat protein
MNMMNLNSNSWLNNKLIKTIKFDNPILQSYSINNKYLIANFKNSIFVFDIENDFKLIQTLIGFDTNVKLIYINNQYITGVTTNSIIKIWDLNFNLLTTLSDNKNKIKPTAIIIKDDYVIVGFFNGIIKIWNIKNSELITILKEHKYKIVSFAINDKYISSLSEKGKINLWNNNFELIKTLREDNDEEETEYYDESIAMNNKYIFYASETNTIKIQNLINFEIMPDLISYNSIISSISLNNKYIVSMSRNDEPINIWNIKTFELITSFENPKGNGFTEKILINDKYIFACSSKGVNIFSKNYDI